MGIFDRLFGGGHHGARQGGGGGGHHGSRGYYDNGPAPVAAAVNACPACRAGNAPSARFCQQCGGSLLPRACKECGMSLQPGTRFCGQCGQAAP